MAPELFPAASAIRASTLVERVERRRARVPSARSDRVDAELARRELASWRAQAPFDGGEWFARRLALDGVTEDELRGVLGEDLEAAPPCDPLESDARASSRPAWVADLERAYARTASATPWSIPVESASLGTKTLGFLNAVEPLIRSARERLSTAAIDAKARHPEAPFDPARAVDALLASVPWSLHSMLMRAMVLELNVARMGGRLAGESPEERFDGFIARLRDPSVALAFLADYPVLARSVHRALDKWVRFGAEFLGHLAADWDSIRHAFFAEHDPGLLARADGGAGDSHKDGRSVIVLAFESGARLVYKPRSLAVDVHFQELLSWANSARSAPPFRTLAVLDRGDHGWAEFVVAKPCDSRAEVERFYRRQGGLIALLYVLEAIDFHYENLIAAGEDPVLVDLESLFHARVGSEETSEPDLRLVSRATATSVLRIGILPQRTFATDEYRGIDLSGLSGTEGQLTPDRVLQWDDLATDTMRARRERVAMPGGKNLPELLGSETSVVHFKSELARGFAETYRSLMQHRDFLLADGGPIARFAEDEVRCVLRATRGYGVLLNESFHPDYQRDGIELERFLDRLWVGVDENPHLLRVIAHERADLANGDVPMFVTRPGSRDLWSSRGERIESYLDESGLDLVRSRLRALSEADLHRQLWFVQASLATLEISRASLDWAKYPAVQVEAHPDRDAVREELVSNAQKIGDRLIELSLRDDRDVAWMGLQYDDTTWSLVPLLEDLYSGSSGVIHFLAYLGAVTGVDRYTKIARAAVATYRRRLEYTRSLVKVIGAFNGWGGAIYVLTHWSRLWNEPELLSEARAIAARIGELVDEDDYLDVIGGSAGLIVALAALHRASPSDAVQELARRAGDRLVARAKRMGEGAAWFTRIETELPITGFSHGAAGIAWALCELYRLTGDERYKEAALAGVVYERSRLIAKAGNWLETSSDSSAKSPQESGESALSVAWCYGAPGVGLARLRSMGVLDHPYVREDVKIALETTLARGFGRNHSLCHGDLGNLEFVMQAARELRDPRLDDVALKIQATILASMRANGWLCGVPLSVESPSLMNGLAGVGFGLLRAAHPERVPSVLVLEPPRG